MVVATFADSAGDSLSPRSFQVGALNAANAAEIVQMPLVGTYDPVTVTDPFAYSFYGLNFPTDSSFYDAVKLTKVKVNADTDLLADENTALSMILDGITFEDLDEEVIEQEVNGTTYSATVTVTAETGLIRIVYER